MLLRTLTLLNVVTSGDRVAGYCMCMISYLWCYVATIGI